MIELSIGGEGGEGARVVSHGHSFSSLDFALLTHLLCFGSVYATCPRDAFANFRRLFTAFQVRTTLCDLGGELAQTLSSSPRCDVDSVACPDRASALDPGPGKRSILVWMFESRLTSLHLRGPPPTVLSSLSALPRTAAARHSCGPRPKARAHREGREKEDGTKGWRREAMPPVPCPPRPSPPHVLGALVKKKNRSQKTFEAPPRGTSPPSGDEVQPLSERPHCCHLDCFPFSEKGPDLEPRLEHVFVSHGMVKEHVKNYRGGVCGMPGNRTEIRNDSMCALRGRSSALRKRSARPRK